LNYLTKPLPELEVDRLVYELYGLTEEEIKIVEGESSIPARGEASGRPSIYAPAVSNPVASPLVSD